MTSFYQKLRNKLESLRQDCKYFGCRIALRNLLLWSVRKLFTYRAAIIYEADIEELAAKRDCSSSLSFAIESISCIPSGILRAADIDDREGDSGSRIFVVRSVSEIAFIAKISNKGFLIPNRHQITIPDNALYISCCYTLPDYRGKGLYGIALRQIAVLSRDECNKAYLYVEFENEASIRSVTRMGFHPIGSSVLLAIRLKTYRKFRFCAPGNANIRVEALP